MDRKVVGIFSLAKPWRRTIRPKMRSVHLTLPVNAQNTKKTIADTFEGQETRKIAYHDQIYRAQTIKTFSSLDLALGLVLATSAPRFHASPTWFQSTNGKEIARLFNFVYGMLWLLILLESKTSS